MPQSLSNVLLHIIFSTKNRQPWIDEAIETELFKYLAGICRNQGCPSHAIGGSDDHIHIACTLGRTITIAKLIEEMKTDSSKWMKTHGPHYAAFAWQSRHGALSIGQSSLDDLRRYISRQREHHGTMSYQDEFRATLRKYEIDFDERYVWD